MPIYKTNRGLLDKADALELVLDLQSFAGGENTVSADSEMKSNEAKLIKNWEVSSLDGMARVPGFTKVCDGSTTYPDELDLLVHHFAGTATYCFAISGGNLVKKNTTSFALDHASDASSFTNNILSHAVSAASALWITNSTDNLKRKVIGSAVAAPASVPGTASERIYEHNFRLIAEGNTAKTIYGSRTGTGNWTAADAWSASADAWSMTMPDLTKGLVPGYPSGNQVLAFTKFDSFVISNQPNVTRYRLQNGVGCHDAFTIAKGNEGVFFFSGYPTLGIYLFNGTQFINLTQYNDFVEKVTLTGRMFGIYKNNKYYFFYNETNSGSSLVNRIRIYDAKFGRWYRRDISSSVGDTIGYPALMTKDSNELYVGSSAVGKIYDFEDASTSDNTFNTESTYQTKIFTSKDFGMPIDMVRLKLLKFTITYKGSDAPVGILWTADRGLRTGSQTVQITGIGSKLNTTFTVNTSSLVASAIPKTITKSFENSAVGREFSFDITNNGKGEITEIKRIRITAIALEDA